MEDQQREPAQPPSSDSGKKSVRDARGRFVVGVSGNPKGQAPRTPEMKAVRELAAVERVANIARLVDIRDNAADVWARIEAVKLLLQYSDGKPVTAHQGSPLVNVNVGLGGPGVGMPGQGMSPAEAYRYMVEGLVPATGDHPAFQSKPAIEHEPKGEPK
jgi:hypothetical protein